MNGAQTISSSAQYLDSDELRDRCHAMVTVTLIDSGSRKGLHKKITRARNLQNPVELSDFVALDDTQERLRREIKLQGFEYHYRPQQYREGAITIDVVAKALACLSDNTSYPAQLKVSSRPFENVESDAYKAIFPVEISTVTVVNAYHFFIKIKQLLLNAEKSSRSPEKLVYRHCLYSLMFITLKVFSNKIISNKILDSESINTMLSQPFDEIRQAIFDTFPNGEKPYAYFKKQWNVNAFIKASIVEYCGLSNNDTYKAVLNQPDDEKQVSYLLGQLKKKEIT